MNNQPDPVTPQSESAEQNSNPVVERAQKILEDPTSNAAYRRAAKALLRNQGIEVPEEPVIETPSVAVDQAPTVDPVTVGNDVLPAEPTPIFEKPVTHLPVQRDESPASPDEIAIEHQAVQEEHKPEKTDDVPASHDEKGILDRINAFLGTRTSENAQMVKTEDVAPMSTSLPETEEVSQEEAAIPDITFVPQPPEVSTPASPTPIVVEMPVEDVPSEATDQLLAAKSNDETNDETPVVPVPEVSDLSMASAPSEVTPIAPVPEATNQVLDAIPNDVAPAPPATEDVIMPWPGMESQTPGTDTPKENGREGVVSALPPEGIATYRAMLTMLEDLEHDNRVLDERQTELRDRVIEVLDDAEKDIGIVLTESVIVAAWANLIKQNAMASPGDMESRKQFFVAEVNRVAREEVTGGAPAGPEEMWGVWRALTGRQHEHIPTPFTDSPVLLRDVEQDLLTQLHMYEHHIG